VLQARLDALPPEERDVLQRASVVGRIFWDQAVQRLRTEEMPPVAQLAAVLESLRHRELIRAREESAFTGAKEYIFRHTILHDVTYESVLRRQRRVYHAQVGDWLAENATDRLSEFTGRIADHYEYAGQTQKAITYLTRAVEQSVNIGAFREALTFAERGLTLLGQIQTPAHDQDGQLKFQLGRAHRGLSEYDVARDLYQEALVLFTLVDNKQGIVRVLYELGWLVGYIQRHYAAGVEYFRESLACAEEVQDLRGIAWAYNGLGVMAYFQRDRFEAIHYYEQSLSIARDIGDQIRAAGALNNLGLVKRELGRYNESRLDLEASRALFDSIGSHNEAIAPIVNLGNLSRVLGQHQEAEQYFQEALVTVREMGDRASMASILNSMGNLQRAKGDFQAAQALYLEALLLAREIGVPAGIATVLEGLALLSRLVGHYDEAETHLREILVLAQVNGNQNEVANALMNLGGVLRVQERLPEAREALEQSVMLNMDNLNRESLARAMYYLGEVSAAQGQDKAAERYYRDALALYREFDNRSGLALALGGLGEINTKQGELALGREFLQEAYRIATMVRDTPLVLWLLTVVAAHMVADDEPIRAAELIGMVLYHPALPDEARMRAHQMRAELGNIATIQTAIRRGEARVAANQAVILDEPLWPSVLQAEGL
jgi:tetratricopeptide (TPR) repeat protein